MLDVVPGLVEIQRAQAAAQGDPLAQLAQFVGIEHLPQLRLAHQDDLEELAGAGLQVGEQAELLQDLHAQVLGLVDEEQHLLSLGLLFHEKAVEGVDEILGVVGVRRDVELVVDGLEELHRVEPGVEDVGRLDILAEVLQKDPAKGGLARAHLAGDLHEAVPLGDGVGEMGQGLLVAFAQEKIGRVRHQLEGPFLEAEEVFIHGLEYPVPYCLRP